MIFVSYSRKDEELVNRLAMALRKAKQDYWVDTGKLSYGDNWWVEIERAIKQSRAVAVIMTSAAAEETSFVRKEIRYAIMPEKPIYALIPEYDIAFWIARVAAGLEMSRKTRATYEERIFALLVAADSLNQLIKDLELKPPTGDSITIHRADNKKPSS